MIGEARKKEASVFAQYGSEYVPSLLQVKRDLVSVKRDLVSVKRDRTVRL